MYKTLTYCPLFFNINEQEIETILKNFFFKKISYNKGDIIAHQGNKLEQAHILIEGTTRSEMIDFAGRSIVIAELEAPKLLASAFIFGQENIYPVNIISQTDTTLINIQKNEFVRMMQSDKRLLINFMNIISGRAQFLTKKIKFLSFNTIKGKFAFYLLNLIKDKEINQIELPFSQERIAELFGVTRPSLARTIRDLHKEEIIEANGKQIKILNKKALLELIK